MTKLSKQEQRVFERLMEAKGGWVNGRVFVHEMYLTQFHCRIHTLEKKGVKIEHSTFTDEYGFKSYRINPSDVIEVFAGVPPL